MGGIRSATKKGLESDPHYFAGAAMSDLPTSEIRRCLFGGYEMVVVVHFPSQKTAGKFAVQYQILKDGVAETGQRISHEPQDTLEKAFDHGYSLGRNYIQGPGV